MAFKINSTLRQPILVRVKAMQGGKVVLDRTKRKKGSGRHLLIALEQNYPQADKIYVKVTYNKKLDYYNDGEYANIKDAQTALRQFTEPDLLNYIYG